MIKKGDTIKLGCLGCLEYKDNTILDFWFENEEGKTYIMMLVKCSCGFLNQYKFEFKGIKAVDKAGAKLKY